MADDIATLNELIEVLTDGREFYLEAAAKIDHAETRRLFARMARTKAAIVEDMRARVAAGGEAPAEGGTLAGTIRRFYAEMRAQLSRDSEAQYISQLEEFEDRIVHSFQDVIIDSDDPEVRGVALKYMPDVARDHADMRSLKHAVRH